MYAESKIKRDKKKPAEGQWLKLNIYKWQVKIHVFKERLKHEKTQ